MAFDEYRNRMYAEAIKAAVTPDSVVLDLGAGIGALGLIAAAAGAKRVYLVEPEPIVKAAMNIARANGLDDKIVVLEGKIEDIDLPEQVDLIVSVFTGNLLFSEDLLPSLFYARNRYLKPDGKLIPDSAELMVAPASAPEAHEKHIGIWSKPHHGLDYSSCRHLAANEIIWLDRKSLKAGKLSNGQAIAAIDLTTANDGNCIGETSLHTNKKGTCHGLLFWIRIKLGDQWLSTDPDEPDVHWSPVMLPLDPPLELALPSTIAIKVNRPFRGDWTWTATCGVESRRHSTFFSKLNEIDRLRKIAPANRPGLNLQGQHSLQVLSQMKEGKSNQEIAQNLAESANDSFANTEEALFLVQGLAMRYGL